VAGEADRARVGPVLPDAVVEADRVVEARMNVAKIVLFVGPPIVVISLPLGKLHVTPCVAPVVPMVFAELTVNSNDFELVESPKSCALTNEPSSITESI